MKKWRGILLCLIWACPVWSQASESLLGTAGKILEIGVGPREVAMGEAVVASSDDLYTLYWNPAGLATLRSTQLSYMQNVWLQDIQGSYLAYGQRMPKSGMAFSADYTTFGQFEKISVDNYGYPLPSKGTFTPYTLVVSGGYGLEFSENFDGGIALKIVNETVDTFSNLTLAMDLGLQYHELLQGLDFGLVLQNLGMPLEGYSLPLQAKAGLAYDLPATFNKQDKFTIVAAVGMPVPLGQSPIIQGGLEYSYLGILAGRVGYKLSEANSLGSGAGATAGLGFNAMGFSLDYAVAPFGLLGIAHRISLTYDFDAGRKPKKKTKANTSRPVFTPGKSEGGLMLPPDKTGSGRLLLPAASRMEMRQTVTVEVASRVNSRVQSKLDQAAFTIKIADDKQVRRWNLQILDANAAVVKQFTGKGNPPVIVWDGTDKNRKEVKESVFCTYALILDMQDGTVESQKGSVVEKSKPRSDETPNQEVLTRITFDEGSVDLSAEAIAALKAAARKIVGQNYVKVMVEGHADNGGENVMSFLLSQRRADAVARYLTATFKIPLNKIMTRARGNKNPIASNETEDGRKQNRRVEVTLIYRQ